MCSVRPLAKKLVVQPHQEPTEDLIADALKMERTSLLACQDAFVGRFATIREKLDYSYHSVYSKQRQLLQDDIIRAFLAKGRASGEDPWAIFTAGPMGVGKTHAMTQLQRKGLLSLDDFVYIDPDILRECLPEYSIYLQENAEMAGIRTQKEAGYMAEILTYAALECKMNIIVDGSLRDSSWYEGHFCQLRKQYPGLCLAIFLISAPLSDIYQRVAVRALAIICAEFSLVFFCSQNSFSLTGLS